MPNINLQNSINVAEKNHLLCIGWIFTVNLLISLTNTFMNNNKSYHCLLQTFLSVSNLLFVILQLQKYIYMFNQNQLLAVISLLKIILLDGTNHKYFPLDKPFSCLSSLFVWNWVQMALYLWGFAFNQTHSIFQLIKVHHYLNMKKCLTFKENKKRHWLLASFQPIHYWKITFYRNDSCLTD